MSKKAIRQVHDLMRRGYSQDDAIKQALNKTALRQIPNVGAETNRPGVFQMEIDVLMDIRTELREIKSLLKEKRI